MSGLLNDGKYLILYFEFVLVKLYNSLFLPMNGLYLLNILMKNITSATKF